MIVNKQCDILINILRTSVLLLDIVSNNIFPGGLPTHTFNRFVSRIGLRREIKTLILRQTIHGYTSDMKKNEKILFVNHHYLMKENHVVYKDQGGGIGFTKLGDVYKAKKRPILDMLYSVQICEDLGFSVDIYDDQYLPSSTMESFISKINKIEIELMTRRVLSSLFNLPLLILVP